jgi:hypothetical protein
LADVAAGCGAQERVGYGMQQHIRVAMAHQVARVRDFDASQSQGASIFETMRIVSDANA